MIDELSKTKLYFITFAIDFYIIIVLLSFKINNFDFLWFIALLIVHLIFYFSIYYNFKKIINILHNDETISI